MNFFKKKQPPVAVAMRNTLFGDEPMDKWPPDANQDLQPWSTFIAAREYVAAGKRDAAIALWREVLAQPSLESRHYLQAWHFLRQQGESVPAEIGKQLLGVVVEVGMPKGLDVLAAYPEHTARYYNFSGSGIVWEHPDNSLDTLIDQLLEASRNVVARIGPWDRPRPEPPKAGNARLGFLTPSGLHFGEGNMNMLAKDPLGGAVFHLSAQLLQALTAKK